MFCSRIRKCNLCGRDRALRTSVRRHTTTVNWNVYELLHSSVRNAFHTRRENGLLHNPFRNAFLTIIGDVRRDFHQLFRRLWHGKNRARAAKRRRNLGHFGNMLGNEGVESSEQRQQLVPNLRHRNIEDLQTKCGDDSLLQDVPLDPVQHVRRLGLLQDTRPPSN